MLYEYSLSFLNVLIAEFTPQLCINHHFNMLRQKQTIKNNNLVFAQSKKKFEENKNIH